MLNLLMPYQELKAAKMLKMPIGLIHAAASTAGMGMAESMAA